MSDPHDLTTVLVQRPVDSDTGGSARTLPPDLLEQVRSRVRLVAGLLAGAFALDPVVFLGTWASYAVSGTPLPPEFSDVIVFQWISAAGALASLALWWFARRGGLPPSPLHTAALVYEVAVCLVVSIIANWQHFVMTGQLPNLTWVPAVIIIFPILIPAPPRQMLMAAVAAGLTAPAGLFLLSVAGRIVADADAYVQTSISSAIGIVFAYTSARVIYRLGREVVKARELGSYQLDEQLGRGGMGEVWRARHRMLARPAAVKLIRARTDAGGDQGASQELERRFEREAQAIASLRSPHTVTLFDFGMAADGAFYYAMELLDGIDTDRLVRRFGPLPYERAVFLLRQACHSLAEADARGLVHRDIKPANIFLCRYGEDVDFVKVLDFGLVTALEDDGGNAALTRAHVVQGTPAFIAPEQALGGAVLDGRTDLYGLGCVAYWMLTGQQPFSADTAMALIMHHARTTPVSPSARTENRIPPELDAIVLACLAKEPADRPTSARALSAALATVPGADAWTDERAREWWRLHLPAPA